MKLFDDVPSHSSMMHHHEVSKSRIIGIATIISLILFFSISYQATHLPSFHFYEHANSTVNATSPNNLKAAVIIEGRSSPNLVPLILHFSSVLGPEWPIKVLHTAGNRDIFSVSPAFQRQRSSGHITLQQLPNNVTLTNHRAISSLLADPWLWHQLAPHKHLLFFQTDSILCANSPRMVEDFLHYDFVGAPIDRRYGQGMNGGLSLRNREKILEVLEYYNFTGNPEDASRFEDQWFFDKLNKLPTGPHSEPGAEIPTPEVAAKFAVETIWHDEPFGLHQVSRFQKSHQKELEEWCPEYLLAVGAAFFGKDA
ncbi:MAG: hypothetical protein LQ352_005538 [Teloschistes flavicans]|nr:MAG: hypothetical protein LQ352_005538 [Teloschistes flavicans]